jgi:anti-sigma factor RsiW
MTLHLTHEQLCDLILTDSSLSRKDEFQASINDNTDVIDAHLQACPVCSAELKSLRDSLSHFRNASVSYARQEFAQSYAQRSSIAPPHSFLSQPLYWTAAVVVFAAALFPLSMHRQRPISPLPVTTASASPQTTESDEALLADVEQKVSADVPSPMEPLADPTAGAISTTSDSNQRSN